MTKEELTEALDTAVYSVTFTKKDGTEREMTCTRMFDFLNDYAEFFGYKKPASDKPDDLAGGLIRVWDIDARDWRTVNADTVTKADKLEKFFEELNELSGFLHLVNNVANEASNTIED